MLNLHKNKVGKQQFVVHMWDYFLASQQDMMTKLQDVTVSGQEMDPPCFLLYVKQCAYMRVVSIFSMNSQQENKYAHFHKVTLLANEQV